MVSIKINTAGAVAVANNIKASNMQIRNGFSPVKSAISRLDANWEGAAASKAISKFHEIDSKFSEARYSVVDNYVRFLLQQVGEGYTQTEEVNKSLADEFK